MFPTHGYWCNTRTFPTNCPSCGSAVFFFRCDHESRVFFDALGSPWPLHHCFVRGSGVPGSAPHGPRPSGKTALSTLRGVSFSKEDPNYDLLPGMTRFSGDLGDDIVRRIGARTADTPRETMRIDPLGNQEEELLGRVSDVRRFSLEDSPYFETGTIGAVMVEQQLGSMNVTQITVLVDESDRDVVDLLSYSVWCPENTVPLPPEGAIVSARVMPQDVLGIGRKWVAKALEVLSQFD